MVFNLSCRIPPHILQQVEDICLDFPNQTCREEINRLLKRTVLRKGKRLRPILTHLMGNLLGLRPEEVKLYADSIELVHAASLSHDDVIDQAITRRGIPSINTEGNKSAVLAGDFLLARVMSDLAVRGRRELVKEMGDVVASLSWGEWLQLEASRHRRYNREILEQIALHKTAAVMTWCIVAPAYMASFPPTLLEHCRRLGREFGLAFQWMDDILDFSPHSAKEPLLDLKNGLVNAVVYEHLDRHSELKQRFEKGECLVELLDWTRTPTEAIELVRQRVKDKLRECRELLAIIVAEMPGREGEGEDERRSKALKPIEEIFHYLSRQ